MTIRDRVRPGVPAGGQFTTGHRSEPATALPAPASVRDSTVAAYEQLCHTFPMDPGEQWSDMPLNLAGTRATLRQAWPDLPDAEFASHWDRVEADARVAVAVAALSEVDDIKALPEGATSLLDRDLDNYRELCGPDRPGEDPYTGYDFDTYADDLRDAWTQRVYTHIRGTCQANATAARRTTTAA